MQVDDSKLHPLNVRPSLLRYIRQLWGRRYFIAEDATGKSFDSQKDMFLGRAWLVLSPMLDAAMYGILFGLLLRTSRGIENFIGYLIIGIIFFSYMQAGLNGGTNLIKSSQNMISAFMFPRAALVLSQAARNFISGLAPALVAVVGALAFQWGTPPTWRLLLVIPLYLLIHVFATGVMFIVARLCAFVPDLRSLVRVVGRAWFFTSGVFFSVERYATVPLIQDIMVANPAYQFLQAVRDTVMYQETPKLEVWGYLTVWSVGIFVIGLIFFWRAEERYGTLH
ncbi:ABC transporter permease [Corynebacterium halotolerans]|uniref:ABC transporter permease n=1 Tax=Corynebacterium halotolerans TaxID=225326 RepID=UPI003CFAEBAD